MLPSLGQVATSKSDTLEAEISPPLSLSLSLRLIPILTPFGLVIPSVTDDLRSSIVRPRPKSVSFPCTSRKPTDADV